MARTPLLGALRRLARDHFAGEHCSTDFQGYMEGGAEQGVRAAREILDDLEASVLAA